MKRRRATISRFGTPNRRVQDVTRKFTAYLHFAHKSAFIPMAPSAICDLQYAAERRIPALLVMSWLLAKSQPRTMLSPSRTELGPRLWADLPARARVLFSKAGLVRSALLVSALTVAVKVMGAAKIAISARVLGPGDELDSYLVAFLVPSILCDVLAGSLTPALLPVLAKETGHRSESSPANRMFFLSCLGVFAAAMVVAAVTASWVLPGIAHGFSTRKLQFTRSLLLLMVPMVPLTGLSAMWRAVLNHHGRFALAAASPLLTPLLASMFLLIAHGTGVQALALGTVLGAAAEASLLGAGLVMTGTPIVPGIQTNLRARYWLSSGYAPVLFASVLSAGSSVIDQAIAAGLASGSVSVFNLGTRLVTVAVAIGPASMATVLMPKFSALIADGNWMRLRRLASVSTLAGMLLVLPVVVAGVWFSKPLVELAFGRGARSSGPLEVIAAVQSLSFLQLPFVMGIAVLSRLMISTQKTKWLLFISAAALVLKGGVGVSLARVMGVEGLSLSMGCVQMVVFLMTLRIAWQGLR